MLYAIIAVIIAAGDQLFKFWIVDHIELGGEMTFLPGIVHLTYVKNTGGAFSILNNNTWFLTALSIVLIIAVIVYMIKAKPNKAMLICAACVLGGAIGNAIDRIRLGFVVDMFEVEFMRYAVFNVADCFIVVAVIVFCILYLIQSIKEEKQTKLLGKGKMPEIERLKKNDASSLNASGKADGNTDLKDDNTSDKNI